MSNMNSESLLQSNQNDGFICWIHSLLASQRRNLQNLSALVVFNFLAAGLFFVAQIKIANVIGKEKFGLLAYGIALGMYGQTIVRYGMNRTLVRDLIHYPQRFAELVMASLLLRGVLLGLTVAGLLIWKLLWQPADLSWAIIVVVMAYSLKSLDLQPVYDAWHRMGRHAVYNMFRRALYFALIWGIILTNPQRLTLGWIAFGLLVMELFYLFLQQRWAGRRIEWSLGKVGWNSGVRALLKNNSWVWLASLGGLSFGYLNQIILKHYCGAAELGGYAASWQIAIASALILNQIGRIGNPATARATKPGTDGRTSIRFLLRYSAVMLLTAAPICILVITFPEWILRSIFKPEYALAAGVLRVFGIYILILSLGIVASQYVVSARMERTYFASVIMGGILSLGLCIILIPRLAGLGAALALLIAHGFSMGLYWVAVIQQVRKQR